MDFSRYAFDISFANTCGSNVPPSLVPFTVAMTPRTLRVVAYVDSFIELPYVPTNVISLVEYWDSTNWVAMSVGDYQVLGETTKKVYMTSIFDNEFRFTYTCGYATTPTTMKTALLKMVSDLYEYRESSVEATKPSANLMTAYELMKPFNCQSCMSFWTTVAIFAMYEWRLCDCFCGF